MENVVFCRMSPLQLSLYKHLLGSGLIKSCFHTKSSSGHQFPPHLVCISALKKLCNTPALIYVAAKREGERIVGQEDLDEEEEISKHEVH